MRLRRAGPGDLAAAGAVTVAAYGPFLEGPHDPYVARLADTATRARQAELWVAADDDGTVLGTMTWCPSGSAWRELAGEDEGELRMLAVAPHAQGRGVGALLATAALERAREEQRTAVVLGSLPVMHAAHRLYARLGFVRTPDRDFDPVPGVTLIAFRKDL